MKKKLFLLVVLLFSSLSIVQAAEISIKPGEKTVQFKLHEHWKLNPWHDFLYLIENPTHQKLYFTIKMNPTSKDYYGQSVPSSPIKLTCGDQLFYITEYKEMGMVVCTSKDDIRLELYDLKGNPSSGSFTLQMK